MVHLQRNPKSFYERQFLMGLLDGLAVHKIPSPHLLQIANLFESVTAKTGEILNMRPQVTVVTSAIPNVSQACLTEMRHQQPDKSRPTPVFYTTNMISEERSAPTLQIIDAGLQRCGWLAVDRLCQLHANTPPFPFASIIPAVGWREIEED